jgi:hypothetical protein
MPEHIHEVKLYAKGSREEEAELSLKHTVLTRPMAWTLVGLFLITIFAEPLLQHAVEIRAGLAARRAAAPACPPDQREGAGRSAGIQQAPARVLPQVYDVLTLLPSRQAILSARTPSAWWALLTPVKKIKAFETALEENSVSSRFLLPRAQTVLCLLGSGNEKAYCGRDRWLFFRPEIDYLTEQGFLTPAQLKLRSRSGAEAIQPDPRKAIVQFHEQLRQRGIQLIVMPIPSKAMIDPERFTCRYDHETTALQNPSFAQFKKELEDAGVLVFDVDQALADRRQRTGSAPYLETDTHWRPETMEEAAALLNEFIAANIQLPHVLSPGYKQVTDEVSNLGDIAVMLRLPEAQNLYRKQKVTIHPVLNSRNEFWQAGRLADVLLLGDSFSNVYSFDAMGWGYGAGFAEQISFALQRPVDRQVRNDSGAFATRQMLAEELKKGHDRLKGKKLVIWEFAARELAVGDWKMLDLKSPEEVEAIAARTTTNSSFFLAPAGAGTPVCGIVSSISVAPRPGSVPYKDHILSIHLTDLQGVKSPVTGNQAIVNMWSMCDNKLTRAAKYRPGDKLTLRLKPWADVAPEYDGINQSFLDNEELQLQEPNWGEEITK